MTYQGFQVGGLWQHSDTSPTSIGTLFVLLVIVVFTCCAVKG